MPAERSFSLWGVGIEPELEKTEPVTLGNFAWNFHFVFGTESGSFWGRASANVWQSSALLRSDGIIAPTLHQVWPSGPVLIRITATTGSSCGMTSSEKYIWCHWEDADFSFLLPSSLVLLPLPECLSNIFRAPALCKLPCYDCAARQDRKKYKGEVCTT